MDATTQIKNSLITRIRNTQDVEFLKALQLIFDSNEESFYELIDEQKKSILKGREDIKNGKLIDNDQLISDMKEWLTKK